MRSLECETRTAACYLALNTLRHRQIRWESHRSIIYILLMRKLQVQSFCRHFSRRARLKTQIPGSLLLPRLPPAAPSHWDCIVGVSGWSWTFTMPSLVIMVSGVMMPLEMRDFSWDSPGAVAAQGTPSA